MSSLFVQEESDEDKMEDAEEVMDVENTTKPDESEKKELEKKQQKYDKKFLDELEKEVEDDEEGADKEADDESDPVIKEVGIHLNPVDPEVMKLMVLQYTTRKQSQMKEDTSCIPEVLKYKPKSKVTELILPFEKKRFYNEDKASKWDDLHGELLRGVAIQNDSCQYYMGRVGEDKELHLVPVTGGTSQMRPSFKYIDEHRQKKLEKEAEDAKGVTSSLPPELRRRMIKQETERKPTTTAMHVVQMTAKSSNRAIPRLGKALMSKKTEDEEAGDEYKVLSKDKYDYKKLESELEDDGGEVWKSTATPDEYEELLLTQMRE